MRKESKEMAVTAATMKKEKRNEPAATTFVNYLESWYQNKCLSNSTSSSTAAYYYWMISVSYTHLTLPTTHQV